MKEPSMTAMFHGAKDHGDGSSIVSDVELYKNKEEKSIEKSSELAEIERTINETVHLIKETQLESEYAQDKEQKKLLKKTKEQAVGKILEVFKSINEYMDTIRALDEGKNLREFENQKDYIKNIDNLENSRTRKHNALISDFQSTIRFISYNFAQISEEAIDSWEEEREERGFVVLKAEREKFPNKVICPDNVNIKNRKQVASWAVKVFTISLDKIKKDFPKI